MAAGNKRKPAPRAGRGAGLTRIGERNEFFVTKIVEDSDVTYNLTVAGYVALAAVMLVVFAAGCMFRDKNKKMDAKQIAFF